MGGFNPANIYLSKVNNRHWKKVGNVLKLAIKTPEQRHWQWMDLVSQEAFTFEIYYLNSKPDAAKI